MPYVFSAHILCWFKPREKRKDFKPIPVIERTAPGVEPRQRPLDQKVVPLKAHQADTVYQTAHVGPITAEMVRPDVRGADWGGFDFEKLRIAGLARAIQTRLPYLHHCSSLYCLKNRIRIHYVYTTAAQQMLAWWSGHWCNSPKAELRSCDGGELNACPMGAIFCTQPPPDQ